MASVLYFNTFIVLQLYQYPFLVKNIYKNHYWFIIKWSINLILHFSFELWKRVRIYTQGIEINSFGLLRYLYLFFKPNFSLNYISSNQSCLSFTLVFTVFLFSLSVDLYEMIKAEQNQNISCYSFVISLVGNKKISKSLLVALILTEPLIYMVTSYSNFYLLWKSDTDTFLSFLLFEFAMLYPMI